MQVQTALQYTVSQDKKQTSDWRVEALDIKAGDALVAIFCGPSAKDRAEEYARFKNAQ